MAIMENKELENIVFEPNDFEFIGDIEKISSEAVTPATSFLRDVWTRFKSE